MIHEGVENSAAAVGNSMGVAAVRSARLLAPRLVRTAPYCDTGMAPPPRWMALAARRSASVELVLRAVAFSAVSRTILCVAARPWTGSAAPAEGLALRAVPLPAACPAATAQPLALSGVSRRCQRPSRRVR